MIMIDAFKKIIDSLVFGPEFPDPDENGWEKDRVAIASDWQAVGDDMRKVFTEYDGDI